jgi:hypothetical protein
LIDGSSGAMAKRKYTFRIPRVTARRDSKSTLEDPAPPDPGPTPSDRNLKDSAAEILKYALQSKYLLGFISAVDLAELSHWIHHCGVPGFQAYAELSPLQPSFNANACRSVRRELPMKDIEREYEQILIPMAGPDGTRCLRPLAVKPIYEALAEQFALDPEGAIRAAKDLCTANWSDNKLNTDAQPNTLVLPFGHFVDAAQFRGKGPSIPDSIIIYNVNLSLSASRYVICTIRKEHLCGESVGCPCRGRCSLDVLERYLVWSAQVAANGFHPKVNFCGEQFESLDRRLNAGQPIVVHRDCIVTFALVEFRADGAQYSDLGLRRANQEHFCLKCHASREDMYDFANSHLWSRWTDAEYAALIARSKVSVQLSGDEADKLLASMEWDFRENGAHGRVVKRAAHGLVQGDILMYGGSCLNAYAATSADLQGSAPYHLVFWRPTQELRSPIYVLEFPAARFSYLMLDDLHNIDLGCTARIAGVALLGVLKSGVRFGTPATERGMRLSVAKMNADVARFYKGTGFSFKRLSCKSLCWKNMQSTGHLKGKGCHCSGILPYVVHVLQECDEDFPGIRTKPLLKAAVSLQKAYALMRENPRDIDAKKLGKYMQRVGIQCALAGVPMIPKFHYLSHFEELAQVAGNPRYYSTRVDESLNSDLVRLAQAMHTSEFSARILSRQHLHRQVSRSLEEARAAWLNASRLGR